MRLPSSINLAGKQRAMRINAARIGRSKAQTTTAVHALVVND